MIRKRTARRSVEAGVWKRFDHIACREHDGKMFVVGFPTGVIAGFGEPTQEAIKRSVLYPSAVAAIRALLAPEEEDPPVPEEAADG